MTQPRVEYHISKKNRFSLQAFLTDSSSFLQTNSSSLLASLLGTFTFLLFSFFLITSIISFSADRHNSPPPPCLVPSPRRGPERNPPAEGPSSTAPGSSIFVSVFGYGAPVWGKGAKAPPLIIEGLSSVLVLAPGCSLLEGAVEGFHKDSSCPAIHKLQKNLLKKGGSDVQSA
ncbi:hypothetical protein BSKO_08214 [Bryopsis sp. KO-2023]|nr:hypothetical protein BSKO_08214 [Bryopsis sp. KO-2023]